jgi:hypothetical protein
MMDVIHANTEHLPDTEAARRRGLVAGGLRRRRPAQAGRAAPCPSARHPARDRAAALTLLVATTVRTLGDGYVVPSRILARDPSFSSWWTISRTCYRCIAGLAISAFFRVGREILALRGAA